MPLVLLFGIAFQQLTNGLGGSDDSAGLWSKDGFGSDAKTRIGNR